jgi:hypothetical protein
MELCIVQLPPTFTTYCHLFFTFIDRWPDSPPGSLVVGTFGVLFSRSVIASNQSTRLTSRTDQIYCGAELDHHLTGLITLH